MIEIHENVSLREANTFGLEVSASRLCEVASHEDIQELHRRGYFASEHMVLGGGSNVLFTTDYDGLIVCNQIKGLEVIREDDHHVWLKIGGGEVWHDSVLYTIEKGWQGFENLSLIPGTVGAAPIQNIGAYGVEQKDFFDHLVAVELSTGEEAIFDASACEFGYRDSVFKREEKGKFMISYVVYRLNKKPDFNVSYGAINDVLENNSVKILTAKAISDAVVEIRSSKLPNPKEIGNAGSFFKNPVIKKELFMSLKEHHQGIPGYPQDDEATIKVPAGWLIEQAGWKGKRFGGVGVHQKQALVLVNHADGTGKELYDLSTNILNDVKAKFNISLEREVNII